LFNLSKSSSAVGGGLVVPKRQVNFIGDLLSDLTL
jgi:hypothetical protein